MGGSSRDAYQDCFQRKEKATPLNDKGVGGEKSGRCKGGQCSTIIAYPSPACAVHKTELGPVLVPSEQMKHMFLNLPQKAQMLQTNRHGAVARFRAASCHLSCFSQLPSPKDPITHMLPSVLRIPLFHQMSLCTDDDVYMQAQAHIHKSIISTLLVSSAIITQSCPCDIRQERNKSKEGLCVK